MIRTWKIGKKKTKEIRFEDDSSLDAITRQLPNGFYSTFRTYDSCTRVMGLSAHLHRLPNLDASSFRRQLTLLLEPFRPDEARVRVMLTLTGQLYVAVEHLKRLPHEVYEKGVHVETTSIQRASPRVKSTAFIGQSDEERRHIANKGIFEALLVKSERILEGMTSNFFYVIDGVLCTAQQGILLGVTRGTVIRAARGEGVELKYKSLKLDHLFALHEAFLTSSSRGIVPVVKIDDVVVGRGSVSRITKKLMAAYDEYVLQHAEKIDQGT